MALDATPFGLAISQNGYGFAAPVVLLLWDPNTPKPIPPGQLDAVTSAVQRLYYQFSRDTEGWRKLAAYIGERFQTANDQQAEILVGRLLANAIGQTLDELGFGVGLPRQGLGDADYRQAIRVRGASLDSDGTIPDVLSIVAGLFGAIPGAYQPWYPAAFAILVPSLSASEASLLAFLLKKAIPSGVGLTLVVTDPVTTGWSYSDGATVDTWAGPRWDYSGGSDASATSPWGFAVSV